MITFYIATKKQSNARLVRDTIHDAGHACNSSWIDMETYVSIPDSASDCIFAAAQCEREVMEADQLILISDSPERVGGGKHVEMGMALAMGKPVHVIGIPENIFAWHRLVTIHDDLQEFAEWLSR